MALPNRATAVWAHRSSIARAAFLTLAVIICGAGTTPARGLEFKCVEPSRYKHLLQAFNDDPSLITSYFGLAPAQRPDMNVCRAVVVTGAVRTGDAEALLDQIIAGKGWLGVLYLSFDGVHVEEEFKLAQIVRAFWLKTRFADAPPFRYEPDFASLWGPMASAPEEGTSGELSRLNKGLRAFAARKDLALPIPENRKVCLESCTGAFAAGVNRKLVPPAPALPQGKLDAGSERVAALARAALLAHLEGAALPPARDARWTQTISLARVQVVPPAADRIVRDKCDAELVAGNALAERVVDAMGDLARENFRAVKSTPPPVLAQYDSLRMAGVRLQACVAGAYERERLAAFERLCAQGCDKAKLAKAFEQSGRELAEGALTVANIVGAGGSTDLGRRWLVEKGAERGTWARRGETGTFDATWLSYDGSQPATALEMARTGDVVTVIANEKLGPCVYRGNVTGRQAGGRYTCFAAPGEFAWKATIEE